MKKFLSFAFLALLAATAQANTEDKALPAVGAFQVETAPIRVSPNGGIGIPERTISLGWVRIAAENIRVSGKNVVYDFSIGGIHELSVALYLIDRYDLILVDGVNPELEIVSGMDWDFQATGGYYGLGDIVLPLVKEGPASSIATKVKGNDSPGSFVVLSPISFQVPGRGKYFIHISGKMDNHWFGTTTTVEVE